MNQEIDHNKIINKAASDVLKPMGLFRKGQSRIWIDDNDWFLIIVEFQPSNWDKGSYLNVAVNYLWSGKEYLSFDYGHRESAFVKCGKDEKLFYDESCALVKKAAEKVKEYREFRDIDYAKEMILQKKDTASRSHELYHKMMVCGLAKDKGALEFYRELTDEIKHSALSYEVEYYRELTGDVSKVIDDADKFQEYILQKVNLQREYWQSKSSMKKIKESIEFEG